MPDTGEMMRRQPAAREIGGRGEVLCGLGDITAANYGLLCNEADSA